MEEIHTLQAFTVDTRQEKPLCLKVSCGIRPEISLFCFFFLYASVEGSGYISYCCLSLTWTYLLILL